MRPPVTLLSFLVLPVLEILLMLWLGRAVGGWWVALALVVQGVLGSWIVKHEGRRAWRRLNETLAAGRTPERGTGDAALILLGGVLLALPGFLTDLPALVLLLPFTRSLARGRLLAWAERRATTTGLPGFPGFPTAPSGGPFAEHPQRPRGTGVIKGEVIEDDGEGPAAPADDPARKDGQDRRLEP
ncbi:FxsA family protein [Actinocorallia populi]|uniref:FxsA family protein n=1 Tax=Actinocorallia populi TaxID=2079200 RepID=UPI000D092DDB|nr:FxsA family protein [Actinocorallia populi]